MKPTENANAKGKIRSLKLKRETLRELNAGELKQAQGAGPVDTKKCYTAFKCTGRCR